MLMAKISMLLMGASAKLAYNFTQGQMEAVLLSSPMDCSGTICGVLTLESGLGPDTYAHRKPVVHGFLSLLSCACVEEYILITNSD